jgi:uncharacterized phage infection (PIP) family protein YhgE
MHTIYSSERPARLLRAFVVFAALVSFSMAGSAQTINKDSVSLVSKINNDKEKLAKLQGQVSERTNEKQKAAEQAQQSADDNRKAANKLSNDPQDKKLARKADNEASDARSDAKKARKANDRLEDLNKDIRDLTEKIAKEESKLKKYVVEYKNEVTAPTVIIPKDSVH